LSDALLRLGREQGAGSREQGVGSREQGAGSRERGLSRVGFREMIENKVSAHDFGCRT